MEFGEKYFNGEGYKEYQNFSHFHKRAQWIKENLTGNILEVGCAYGYLIYELDKLGVSIYGVDKSEYVGTRLLPEISRRVSIVDVMDMSLSWNYYDWIISWNLLDCLDDEAHAEAVAYLLNKGKNQLHVLCMSGDYEDYLIRELSFWRKLLPNAYLVCSECGKVSIPEGGIKLNRIPLHWELVSD